ncbi:MAG TPA: FAD-binding oxidoreductase [Nitrococcus sp.]|nr:FAD-binding oxidoreductase [Nitrococcus sp.]
MAYTVTLLRSGCVTHNVLRLTTTRPEEFDFVPGQGVRLVLTKAGWEKKGRPFTPTSLREDGVLEFTIKIYDDHDGVTRQVRSLRPGDTLQIGEPFGAITYRGPGVYIAGGAGITPFLAHLRTLAAEGKLDGHGLLFSNRTPDDVIEEHELRHYLGDRCVFTCTRESRPGYLNQRIDQDFLAEHISDFNQYFYICGPRPFNRDLNETLQALGVNPERLVCEG